jgi:hypothetical protein
MKKQNSIKPTKTINTAIVAKMKEGYSQRKAISVAGLKDTKKK